MTTKTFLRNLSPLIAVAVAPLSVHGNDAPIRHTDSIVRESCSDEVLRQLVNNAVSAEKATSASAWSRLRAEGSRGLEALFRAHSETISAMREGRLPLDSEKGRRLRAALDSVAQQRDAFASGLFWFTDFAAAQDAARASVKPILSLRLLGRLDEEFSCANSRFFRTTLYANADVAAFLRNSFILHWQSVRPAPRVSIDFGDGRHIERTITGNSIHYVVDAEGNVIDALPGLLGPKAFLADLRDAIDTATRARQLSSEERAAFFAEQHRNALSRVNTRWTTDMSALGLQNRPLAQERARLGAAEGTLSSNKFWSRLGALHRDDSGLDESSRALLRAKNPSAEAAGVRAVSKTVVEAPLLRALRNFETTIAEDTARNEYMLHFQVHEWLANTASFKLDDLNRRIYAELFLTPDEDPWLGLAPLDSLTALDNEGR